MKFIKNIISKIASIVKIAPSAISNVWGKVKHIGQIGHHLQRTMPPKVKNFFSKYGDTQITSLKLFRTPIKSFIDKALNFISLGKWEELKAKYGYDRFFHLGLIANDNIIIERNQTINISHHTPSDNAEFFPLQAPNITLNELFNNALNNVGDKIYEYDAFTNNCQIFARDVLKYSNLLTPQAESFIMQPVDKLVQDLPDHVSKVAKAVTDLGAVGDLIHQHITA